MCIWYGSQQYIQYQFCLCNKSSIQQPLYVSSTAIYYFFTYCFLVISVEPCIHSHEISIFGFFLIPQYEFLILFCPRILGQDGYALFRTFVCFSFGQLSLSPMIFQKFVFYLLYKKIRALLIISFTSCPVKIFRLIHMLWLLYI